MEDEDVPRATFGYVPERFSGTDAYAMRLNKTYRISEDGIRACLLGTAKSTPDNTAGDNQATRFTATFSPTNSFQDCLNIDAVYAKASDLVLTAEREINTIEMARNQQQKSTKVDALLRIFRKAGPKTSEQEWTLFTEKKVVASITPGAAIPSDDAAFMKENVVLTFHSTDKIPDDDADDYGEKQQDIILFYLAFQPTSAAAAAAAGAGEEADDGDGTIQVQRRKNLDKFIALFHAAHETSSEAGNFSLLSSCKAGKGTWQKLMDLYNGDNAESIHDTVQLIPEYGTMCEAMRIDTTTHRAVMVAKDTLVRLPKERLALQVVLLPTKHEAYRKCRWSTGNGANDLLFFHGLYQCDMQACGNGDDDDNFAESDEDGDGTGKKGEVDDDGDGDADEGDSDNDDGDGGTKQLASRGGKHHKKHKRRQKKGKHCDSDDDSSSGSGGDSD